MSLYFDRPVLAGRHVRLEPLTLDHAEGLLAAGTDPGLWTWLPVRQPADLPEMQGYVSDLLARLETWQQVTWAQIDARTGEVAGVTSYHDVVPKDRGLYIGSTWIGRDWHRTGMNTEAKLMLMERAFDTLDVIRVGWMTHHENLRSQRAIERLGAKREGVLRNHRIMPDGSIRHSHVYSVTVAEWPAVRDALRARLATGQTVLSGGRLNAESSDPTT